MLTSIHKQPTDGQRLALILFSAYCKVKRADLNQNRHKTAGLLYSLLDKWEAPETTKAIIHQCFEGLAYSVVINNLNQ